MSDGGGRLRDEMEDLLSQARRPVHSRRRLRIWLGAGLPGWLRLLRDHGPSVTADHWHWVVLTTAFAACNSVLGQIQEILHGRRIRRAAFGNPIFIIGHWRSGTTWLHELLTLDERFTSPTTYECFQPCHSLLTAPGAGVRGFGLPARRPMDDVPMGWNRPQEDEFALCNLGLPSPYFQFAFPNRRPLYPEYYDLGRLPPEARRRWSAALTGFLKQIAADREKPFDAIVLKSPTHTFRIPVLLEIFPGARFIHIVRDPRDVFPSTVNMLASMMHTQALHRPDLRGLDDYVLDTFDAMYRAFENARPLLDPRRFFELRYEDLVADPVSAMRSLYEHLDLGGFAEVLPRLEEAAGKAAGYRTNRYRLGPELTRRVAERWGRVMHRYGYDLDPAAGSSTGGAG
jgi:hypothetical protein